MIRAVIDTNVVVSGLLSSAGTGNKRHFPEASYDVTRVVSASELLDWITSEL